MLGVDDHQRRRFVVVEVAAVRIGQRAQIALRDVGLHRHAALAHPLDQRVGLCLQVDHQVRHGRLRPHAVEDLLVQPELVVVEREPREQRILVEQEIAGDGLGEQVALPEIAQLIDTLEQEEELRGQRIPPAIPVEALEEGVAAGLLEHQLRAEALGELARQRGLADTDRPLDDDVAIAFERRGDRVHERKMK